MKLPHRWLTAILSLLITAAAPAAIQSVPLKGSAFNLTGAKVVGCPLFQGRMTTVATLVGGNTLITDATADFTPLDDLHPSASCTIELGNGGWGIIIGWTATTILVEGDITSYICQIEPYIIRQAQTLTSLFGTGSCLQLQGGLGPGTADLVYVPDGTTFWKVYYYSNVTNGWRRIGSTAQHDCTPIYFVQGMFIRRIGPDTTIAFTGDKKLTPTVVDTDSPLVRIGTSQLTCMSAIYLPPKDIAASGLKSPRPMFHPCETPGMFGTLLDGASLATADLVYMSEFAAGLPTGGFDFFYHDTADGMVEIGTGPVSGVPLRCGVMILHRAGRYVVYMLP